jgi:hypothetical protein
LTLSSAGWDSGVYGSAVRFSTNSGSAFAGNPQSWALSGDLTLACWVNISGGGSFSPMIVGTNSDGAHGWKQHYMIRMDSGTYKPKLFIRDVDSDTLQIEAPSSIQLNTWTHLAGTFNATTGQGKLYVDGVPVNSDSYAAGVFSGWDPTTLVTAGIGDSPYSINGLYDEIHLYDEVLDAAAIAALAYQSPPRTRATRMM